jgi:hypothetical protein
MIKHSIEDLQGMVEFCRDHHRSPAHWLALLARARLIQIKREVRAKHKAELEAKRVGELV